MSVSLSDEEASAERTRADTEIGAAYKTYKREERKRKQRRKKQNGMEEEEKMIDR